jgi:hypothetical protein
LWDGATLAPLAINHWYWTGDTRISSVAVGDVAGDDVYEIVTGGYYHDGSRMVAQLCVWSLYSLSLQGATSRYNYDDTYAYSVALGNVDRDDSLEIATGGLFWEDLIMQWAQLKIWEAT